MPTRHIKEPSQARARARRNKILACTETLVIEGGADAVTTTSIATAADVPVGSVYRYFEDRDHILRILYDTAYEEVEQDVLKALLEIEPGQGFKDTHKELIHAFWRAAHDHKSFRPLTRWANSRGSLWDVTPGPESSLGQLVMKTIEVAGVTLPSDRRDVMLRTAVTTLSVLIDQAIEETDEEIASALIEEIATLFAGYIV